MEHDINLSHLFTVGFFATFRGLRRAIGVLGLVGLIAAGILGLEARKPVQQIVANTSPVCNREVYQAQSAFLPPSNWGDNVKSIGANSPSFYVHEAKGTGWCLVKQDHALQTMNSVNGDGRPIVLYVHRWYEVPSQYGDRIQQLAPPRINTTAYWAMGIGFISAGLLFCIWLPATILAAVGRRLIRNAQEEIHG